MEKNYPRESSPTPPPYSVVKNMEHDYPTKGSGPEVEQGYTYPQGYSNVPQQYNQYPPQGATVNPGQPGYPTQQQHQQQQQPQQQPQTNYIIVNQPKGYTEVTVGGATNGPKPPSYMCFSIFVCLCCSLLFGVIALVFSCKSNSAYEIGQVESAKKYGEKSKTCSIIGFIVGIIFSVTYAILLWMGYIPNPVGFV